MNLYPATHAQFTAIMEILSKGSGAYLQNVTTAQWEIVTSPNLWIAEHKSTARDVLESIIYGTLDMLGLGRYEVPTEYVAAVIALTVNPCNFLPACSLLSGTTHHSVDDMSRDSIECIQRTMPRQLFAMVIQATCLSAIYRKNFAENVSHLAPVDLVTSEVPPSLRKQN